MRYLKKFSIFSVLLSTSGALFAFPAEDFVKTANPVSADDLVIIELKKCKSAGNVYGKCFVSYDGKFSVHGDENKLYIDKKLPRIFGFKYNSSFSTPEIVRFTSMDYMKYASNPPEGDEWDMKLFFNQDFTWIELSKSDNKSYEVESSVVFFGPDESTYQYYTSSSRPSGTEYTNYAAFKAYIQKVYADRYDPDHVGVINYRKSAKAAILDQHWAR